MGARLQMRLIFAKPGDYWLSEREVERGYWGFVRCRRDYEREKASVKRWFKDLIRGLRDEGVDIELLPEVEIQNVDDLLGSIDEMERSDVNVVLVTFPMGVWSPGDLTYGIIAASKYAVFFDKFKPNTYAGTLFTPPAYQMLKQRGLANNVFLVEEDVEKLKAILRAIYGLKRISSARLVCVGPMNSAFGGWITFKKGVEVFGYETRFYTYEEFVKDFKAFLEDEEMRKKAMEVVDRFVSESIEVVEPTEEKLLRAGIYYMVLKKYVDMNGADWVSVNCLSELLEETKATPCLAFSILNDSGIVATCEADPTAMILHYLMQRVSGKPAFFSDPTVNEKDGTLILAHCTSPTKLLGYDKPALPYQVRTHHETNYSATPKPIFSKGTVTIASLSFDLDKMLIVKGEVVGTPDLRICRSQVEVKVKDPTGILEDWQGFHWILVYGDYVEELKAICKMKGIKAIVYG
ncbi:MAG: L-fucose isomerase-like protein [Candidatus Bathyarchaeota archaeon B24]|nr:MAG: L-fucose isomerase-like protein [Candidatus Bathyarchaeota archaeon B24]